MQEDLHGELRGKNKSVMLSKETGYLYPVSFLVTDKFITFSNYCILYRVTI